MTNFNHQRTSAINCDFQTAIPTLDRKVMEDILTTQFCKYGVSRDIACCSYKGVPLHLIRCENGVSYVCTRAQALYFINHLNVHGVHFRFTEDVTAFRVFPELVNIQHKDKGAQYGTHYTSLAKSKEYKDAPAVLPL